MSVTKTNYIKILNFRHFFKYIAFTSEGDKIRNKEIKNYINVSVVVDIEYRHKVQFDYYV